MAVNNNDYVKNNSGWWIVFVVFLVSGSIKIILSLNAKTANTNGPMVNTTDSAKMVAQPNQVIQSPQPAQAIQSQSPDSTSAVMETVNPNDTSSMKHNLLGNAIPGVTFTDTTEFSYFSVADRTENMDRMECLVNVGFTFQSDAQIKITYYKNNNNWYLLGVKEIYIEYDQPVPVDNWVQVCPIPNCNWSIRDDSKLSWKTDENGPEYQSGSDVPHLNLPKSDCFFLKSREEGPLMIQFVYTPIN